MDYEELEFDLEILPDRIQDYDSYIYLKKFNNFLNYSPDKIELLFRIDVLEGIIICLPLKEPEDIVTQLESLLGSPIIIFEHRYNSYRFDDNSCVTWLLINDNTYILISNNNLITPLFSSLLW